VLTSTVLQLCTAASAARGEAQGKEQGKACDLAGPCWLLDSMSVGNLALQGGLRPAKMCPMAGEAQRMNMGSEWQIQANPTCSFSLCNEVVSNTYDPEIQRSLEGYSASLIHQISM